MKLNLTQTAALALCALAGLPTNSQAELAGPYTADSSTPFLFHFDEVAGGSATTNVGTFGGTGYTVTNSTTAGLATTPVVTTMLGAASFAGFGNAMISNNVAPATNGMVGFDVNGSGAYQSDNNLTPDRTNMNVLGIGNGGQTSFTIEAMVSTVKTNALQEIVCSDSSAGSRGFQFRINANGQLEFNLIASGGATTAPIPTFTPNTWYHAAVTYDGAFVRLFWTEVNATTTQANQLVARAVNYPSTLGTVTGPIVIGNENRAQSTEPFLGRIDEVRISKVARHAGQMLFATTNVTVVQQPLSQGVDYAGTGLLSVGVSSVSAVGYQWRTNGVNLSGATNSSYTFSNASQANAGNYDCVITNAIGTAVTSSVAVVTVGAANFLAHRYSFTADSSDSVGSATGTNVGGATISGGALVLDGAIGSYMQMPGGLVLSNHGSITIETWATFGAVANNTMLFAFGDTNLANGRQYLFCTPHSGANTRIAISAADPGFNAEQNLSSAGVLDNRNVHLVAVFNPLLGYETLYTNGVLAGISTNVAAPLASVSNVYSYLGKSLYSGDPYLAVTNDEFRIYSGALSAASIQKAFLQGPDNILNDGPVAYVSGPANVTVAQGLTANFSAVFSGREPIAYQWFKNGTTPIAGATNATYSFTANFADNGATYTLRATNNVGGVNFAAVSSSATLTVLVPPTLVWLGATDGFWDTTTLNWTNPPAAGLTNYTFFSSALFDDRGTAQPNVDLAVADLNPLALTANSTATYKLTSSGLNGSLSGAGSLTKSNTGTLIVDVTNTMTGRVLIAGGTLQIGDNTTSGSLGGGLVTNNATLDFKRADALGVANAITGSGSLVQSGVGATVLTGSNSYTGLTAVQAGTLSPRNSAALGTAAAGTDVASGAQVYIDVNIDIPAEAFALNGAGALHKGGAGVTTLGGPITLVTDAGVNVDGGATLNLTNATGVVGTDVGLTVTGGGNTLIAGPVTLGTGILTKSGNGTLTLNSAGAFSGGVSLTGGPIQVNHANALGTGLITVNSSTTPARINPTNGITITNDITITSGAGGAARGILELADNQVATFSGVIQNDGVPASGGTIAGPGTTGLLDFTGPINGSAQVLIRLGRVRLSGGGNVTAIRHDAGILFAGANNGLPSAATITQSANGVATIDLNGFNQELAGLTLFGANSAIVTNSSGTLATLTLNTAAPNTYGGVLAGNLRLLKLGADTLTLTNANAYTGNTTVSNGTLQISLPTLAANSTVAVASGAVLQLDFPETNTVAGLVLNGAIQVPGVYNNGTSSPFITGTGSLLVAPAIATNPTNITSLVSGTTLSLSWPADHLGWFLQTQTNTLGIGLKPQTNFWFDVPGSEAITNTSITMDKTNPTVFFRLRSP